MEYKGTHLAQCIQRKRNGRFKARRGLFNTERVTDVVKVDDTEIRGGKLCHMHSFLFFTVFNIQLELVRTPFFITTAPSLVPKSGSFFFYLLFYIPLYFQTKIQCKNINVNIIYDVERNVAMEAFLVRRVKKDEWTCF